MEWLVSRYRVWMSHDHAHKTVQPTIQEISHPVNKPEERAWVS